MDIFIITLLIKDFLHNHCIFFLEIGYLLGDMANFYQLFYPNKWKPPGRRYTSGGAPLGVGSPSYGTFWICNCIPPTLPIQWYNETRARLWLGPKDQGLGDEAKAGLRWLGLGSNSSWWSHSYLVLPWAQGWDPIPWCLRQWVIVPLYQGIGSRSIMGKEPPTTYHGDTHTRLKTLYSQNQVHPWISVVPVTGS